MTDVGGFEMPHGSSTIPMDIGTLADHPAGINGQMSAASFSAVLAAMLGLNVSASHLV